MDAGGNVPPVALESSPPPFLNHSPSILSSPLSDVGDKDAEDNEFDINPRVDASAPSKSARRPPVDGIGGSASGLESDEESRLSDVNLNDSEAETERLYNSPRKSNGAHRLSNVIGEDRTRPNGDRRRLNLKLRSSNLQEQLRIEADGKNHSSDIELLSDADEADDDASSAPDNERSHQSRSRSASPLKGIENTEPTADFTVTPDTRQAPIESRKRKRSLATAGTYESEQPLKKRVSSKSNGVVGHDVSAKQTARGDDEVTSTTPHSGDPTGEEDNEENGALTKIKVKLAKSIEQEMERPKRISQNGLKRRKNKIKAGDTRPNQGITQEDSQEERQKALADAPGPEDETVEDVEEAEATHRGEEELGRKKAAWEELTAIEKQFSSLRERLYQERLEQLNQEEAMLTKENPDHSEYLAMMRCIDERRDERIRVSAVELQLKNEVLKNRAVAERAQIMSQFHQQVRELREELLEELGNEWYEVQHERRRHANTIPDFSLRFPSTKQESVRNAVAYNKEVSILSGFAKHVGFPAAPTMNGASEDQLETDFDAIIRTRESMRPSQQHAAFRQHFTEGLPFGRNLTAAAEQFMEQTPWANPNHPAHHHALHQPPPDLGRFQFVGETSTANRRHSHQPGGTDVGFPLVNGESSAPMQRSPSSAGRESFMNLKAAHGSRVTRESVAQPN